MSFYIKQNDTTPSLRADLKNGSGDAIDLINATVRFHMRPIGSITVTIDTAAVVISESGGTVQYNWVSGDTSVMGSYQVEFEVTYQDGTIETFPNNRYIEVEITEVIA